MNELIAGPLDYYLGVLKQSRGRALGTSGNASPGPVGYKQRGSQDHTRHSWEHRESGPRAWSGKPSAGRRRAWGLQGRAVPPSNAGYSLSGLPTSTWCFFSSRWAPWFPEKPLRATILSRVLGDSGAQFQGHPRTHCGPCLRSKAGRSRGTRELHGRRIPAAQPAGAPRRGTVSAARDVGI